MMPSIASWRQIQDSPCQRAPARGWLTAHPDSLTHFVSLFGFWGYLVIFVIVALECQAILGLFMPGESLVLIAGFLAHRGTFDPGVLAFVIAAAAILGDGIGFEFGRRLGLGWLIQSGRRFGDVLADIAFGCAWPALCLTAVNTLRRYRAHRDTGE